VNYPISSTHRDKRLTISLGVEDELDRRRVVVGVHDAHAGVLGPELRDPALQRGVVHPRQRVQVPDAPAPGAVHPRRPGEHGQVQREAAGGRQPRHHQLRGALRDQPLDAPPDGVDDVRDQGVHLRQRPRREERRAVVVAAERAHDEQRPPEKVPALWKMIKNYNHHVLL
jgi:hypothetical protein